MGSFVLNMWTWPVQRLPPSALCSLDSVSGPAVSIQTELAVEQLQQKHDQELQQLHIQLETQVLRLFACLYFDQRSS